MVTEYIANRILSGTSLLGFSLTESQLKKLVGYINLLEKWNGTFNLTAIKIPEQMVSHHLMDSLVVGHYLSSEQKSILDVGSGAGLPGIPLSILFPEKSFTLLDSNGKKTRFIKQTIIELDLQNCEVVNERVENFQPEKAFDVVISRAFSQTADFINGTSHLLKPKGQFYAMKGVYPAEEIKLLPQKARILALEALEVPFLEEQRHLLIVATAD